MELHPIKKNKETEITVCGLFGVGAGTTVGQSLSCCIQKPFLNMLRRQIYN